MSWREFRSRSLRCQMTGKNGHATALRVRRGHPNAQTLRTASARRRGSGRGDQVGVKYNSDLAAEEIEEDRDAFALRHAFEQTEAGRECAVEYADSVACAKRRPEIELDEAVGILAAFQSFDDPVGHRGGIFAVTDKPGHADRRVDRSPALRRKVDRHKQIAREQRRRDGFDAAGMAPSLQIAGEIDIESLTIEVRSRFRLAVRMGMGDEP